MSIINSNYETIISDMKKKLIHREYEKNNYGEVFTPPFLINEMLDKLPESVWSNEKLKWLEPACGFGNFAILIYFRLMTSLSNKYNSKTELHNHVIHNMLFMIDINENNIKQVKNIFGKDSNSIHSDFLNHDTNYDIIIGNPPFNDKQVYNSKKGGGDSLWPKFVIKSLSLLNKDGYLLFVHPPGWRKPMFGSSKNKELYQLMTASNQMEYLEIHSKKDGIKTFNIQTRYDWYLIKKTPKYKDTIVKDEISKLNKIDLAKWPFLPNYNYNKIKKMLIVNDINDSVIYSRNQYGSDSTWTNKEKTSIYKYPLIHSTPKRGTVYYWASTKDPNVKTYVKMFGVPKVIFGESGINDVIVDDSGKYGMTQEAIGLKITSKQDGIKLKQYLESNEFNEIIKSLTFGNFRIDWRIFLYFNPKFYKKDFIQTKKNKPAMNKHKITLKKLKQ